jgi:hypothetical protein
MKTINTIIAAGLTFASMAWARPKRDIVDTA